MRGHGEGQPHIHATAVAFHRSIQELLDFSKSDNLIELALDFRLGHAENGTVQEDVFATREFGMEPRSHFQQARDASLDANLARSWGSNAGEDFEQGAFARAVPPDNAEDFALFDLEGDIAQAPHFVLT